jgi:hypothetical protein
MKLTSTTNVSVDGVMQSLGVPDEDRRGGFERGGWALPLFDKEAATSLLRDLPARRRLLRRQHPPTVSRPPLTSGWKGTRFDKHFAAVPAVRAAAH